MSFLHCWGLTLTPYTPGGVFALGADLKFEDIIDEVAGVYPRIMQEGDMDAGAWSCGMVAGLIDDIPTVQELIDNIMAEADGIINERLRGFCA